MNNTAEKMDTGESRRPPDIFRAARNNDIAELARALGDGQLLSDQKADLVNMTPVHVACLNTSNDFLAAAAQHHSFDPWIRDDNLRTPFDHASARNNRRAQRILLDFMSTRTFA